MNRTYSYPIATKVLFVILVVPLSGLFAYIGYIPFTFDDPDTATFIIFILLGAIPIILMLMGVIEIFRCTVILEEHSITRTGVFGTRTLRLISVRGFKEENNGIRLLPRDLNARAIGIPDGLSEFDKLKASLAVTVPEIKPDSESDEPALAETIHPVKKGAEKSLARTKLITRALNVSSGVAAAWYYFLPSYPSIEITAVPCIFLPLAGIAVMRLSEGMVDLDSDTRSGRPVVLWTLLAPAFALFLSFTMFHILDYARVWPVMATVFGLVIAGLYFASASLKKGNRKRRIIAGVTAVLFALLYSFGFTVTTNTVLDRSEPRTYAAPILKKYIGSGKSRSTNFVIGPWGPAEGERTIIVPLALYKTKEAGDSVTVLLHKGFYGIPSYEIAE